MRGSDYTEMTHHGSTLGRTGRSRASAGPAEDSSASAGPAEDSDAATLGRLGYKQELLRGMGAFSNFAISMSIICILAGGVTSFHQGLSQRRGARPSASAGRSCASSRWPWPRRWGRSPPAFPTAGGLYHWASILGGKGWGWTTAWLNLLGMVAALAAINLGALRFTLDSVGPVIGIETARWSAGTATAVAVVGVLAICASQALVNHLGIRLTTRLTDFSGYWILAVALLLTVAMLAFAPSLDLGPPGDASRTTAARAAAACGRRRGSMALLFVAELPPARLHDHRLRRFRQRGGGDGERGRARAARDRAGGGGLRRSRAG